MAAPKGNQFWKQRAKHGRDRIFSTADELWSAAVEYFQWCEDNPLQEQVVFHAQGVVTHSTLNKMRPFTIHGLCSFLDCHTKFLNRFENTMKERNDDVAKDFCNVITRIKETIYNQKFEGAAAGFLNPNIIARDLGLKDSTDVTSDGDKITPPPAIAVEIIKPKDDIL